jgi:hypothetical protein
MKPCLAILALSVLDLLPRPARAEHADIDLTIKTLDLQTGKALAEASATADQEPPLGGHNPRPLFRCKVNEPLALQFFLTSTYPHGEKKNVTVRYFVVRESQARQKTLPDLRAGTVTQGHFVLNLKPQARVGARVQFTIREPGIYWLRVDTLNTDSDHEHISGIDLKVE